ncbi:MAG: LytTR family DNA-binding domain-containing protein [Saprospiraceae bacterium]
MLKCYILDDEQQAVDALAALLKKKFASQVQLVGSTIDVRQAIEEIDTLQPDVVFLDVEMPVMSGLEVLRHFPQRNFHVIFTTAHEKYALPALKAAATDYLVKPLSPQDVFDAIQKCMVNHEHTDELKIPSTSRITLTTSNEMLLINTEDIIRVEADNNYSQFYFTNRPKLLISKTLKEFEEQLVNHDFFRIHQSHLINLHHVESVQTIDGGYVMLKQGHKVEISRRRKTDFLARLKKG